MSGLQEVRKSWGWFLLFGILLMILGVVCVGTAHAATTVSMLVLGWILVFSGVVWLVNAFRAWNWAGFFLYLLNAVVRGVMGYLLVRHPHSGAEAITMLVAALFLIEGLFRIGVASVIQFPTWGWTVFTGICSIVLGFLLLIYWPSVSTFFIGLAIGIDLLLDGAALVGFAAAIHSLPKVSSRTA
jgi:uncharacterized membrane protein HdeD (DUF308 family)